MTEDAGDCAYRLLLDSVRVEPSFVNAYACLAEWFRAHGEAPYDRLRAIWESDGGRDARALPFVEQYRRGDPALRLAAWCRRTAAAPALIVDVGDDLEFVDLYDYSGRATEPPALIGRIHSPRLMCSPRDFGELPAAKQTIAEDVVKRGKDFRIVSHRGTTVSLWDRSVFGPAIDTMHFNAVLHKTVYRSRLVTRAARAVEIGVGSGFLLCSMAEALARRPLEILGTDIDLSAIATASSNVRHVLNSRDAPDGVEVRLERDADALGRLPSQSVDVLLCNPPYIPERTYAGENAYSGTRVVESLLSEHAPRLLAPGGVAVMLFSSLAHATVLRCLRSSPLVSVPLAPGRRVPLDLREVASDPAWVALLLRDHGLEETLYDPAYVYWHTLHIVALCRPEDGNVIHELTNLARRSRLA